MRLSVLAYLVLFLAQGAPASQTVSPADQTYRTIASSPALLYFSHNFNSLFDAAVSYLLLEQDPRWQPVEEGPLLELGDSHPQVTRVRTLLRLYGDLQTTATTEDQSFFDRPLHQAVLRFQSRHGAKVDGIVGPKTRALLNVPPALRADQLMRNIARMETIKAKAGSRFVMVNIPEFTLRMMEDESVVLEMKTIIGRKSRKTPLLQSQIESLVLNPSWNVPRSIAYKDILPKWRADKDYLNKHNLKVLAGWGREAPEVPADQADQDRFYRGEDFLRFWQPPGEDNALGRIKFVFPNKQNIYMHDTPQRALFNRRVRAFSSGCVRVEKPRLLAESLLRWSGNTLPDDSLDTTQIKTRWVRLAQPVPVYFTYWTAWVDHDRVLHFGEDIYQLNDPLQPVRLAF